MTKLLATDLILAARDGDPTTIIGKLNGPDAKDRAYIQAMVHHCAVAGIDPFIALTQWLVETSNGESVRWNNDLNPSGLGIPADSTVQPFKIADGDEAARIHAQALYSAVTGKLHDRIPLPDASLPFFTEIWLPKVNNRNYPGVTTVDDLNTRYTANGDVHATWAWDADYVTTLISRCATFYPDLREQSSFTVPIEHPQGGTPVSETIVFGRVPKPTIENRICKKAGDGHGYWEVSPRQIVGGCRHVTDGGGTIEWYQEFFSIGGERADDALVDFIIDRSGRIAMLNDPFGTRSPWANGGTDGLEGDGVAFYNTLGVAAVNGRLFSCEHVGGGTDAMTAAQLKSSIALWAWIFDGASNHPRAPRVPYNSYPINPAVGINTDLEHFEFATKPCPGSGMRAQTSQHQDGVRALLKQYQVVTSTDPVPVPEEPVPANIYPPGMTVELARRLYGKLKVDWAALPFAFDPERSECRHWLDAGKAQLKPGDRYDKAKWPKIEDCIRRGNGNRVFTWSDGSSFEQPARSN
jgi:N-acetylmuramoyl-L-alanine amidase.